MLPPVALLCPALRRVRWRVAGREAFVERFVEARGLLIVFRLLFDAAILCFGGARLLSPRVPLMFSARPTCCSAPVISRSVASSVASGAGFSSWVLIEIRSCGYRPRSGAAARLRRPSVSRFCNAKPSKPLPNCIGKIMHPSAPYWSRSEAPWVNFSSPPPPPPPPPAKTRTCDPPFVLLLSSRCNKIRMVRWIARAFACVYRENRLQGVVQRRLQTCSREELYATVCEPFAGRLAKATGGRTYSTSRFPRCS